MKSNSMCKEDESCLYTHEHMLNHSLLNNRVVLLKNSNSLDHVIHGLELVRIYSIFSFSSSSCQSTMKDRRLFPIFLSISILQEDRKIIFACSTAEDIYEYFHLSSSSSKSSRSTRDHFKEHMYYFNYSSLSKPIFLRTFFV